MKAVYSLRLYGTRIKLSVVVIGLIIFVYWYQCVYGSPRLQRVSVTQVSLSNTKFIYIHDSTTSLLIFSAYRDRRISDIIRIIGVGRIQPKPQLLCNWMNKGRENITTPTHAKVSQILHQKLQYDGLFIDCHLPSSKTSLFVGLSLKSATSNVSIFTLPIKDIPIAPPRTSTLAACVCPLFGDKLDARNLIAWIEMNRLLGVERFVFYNYSAPAGLDTLFKYYTEKNVVEFLEWDIHQIPTALIGIWPPPENKLHYYGQFAANNECLYRMMFNGYRYVMFADLDELMVPTTRNQTLVELLQRSDKGNVNAFVFRNSYVLPDVVENDRSPVKFIRHAVRDVRVLPAKLIPKIIVRPHLISKIGIHDVISKISGTEKVFQPSEALRLHYSDSPTYLKSKPISTIKDDRVLLYKQRLLRNIEKVEKMLETYKNNRK